MKLWNKNPRLNEKKEAGTSQKQIINDFFENSESDFTDLLRSISEKGWLSFEAIVVCQDSKGFFVVLEGNRRIAALKLFLNPALAPQGKTDLVKKYASKVQLDSIKKISVCIAPSFEEAMYFITARHTTTPIDKWNHEAQMRWLLYALERCNGNLEDAIQKTNASLSDFYKAKRITQIVEYAKQLKNLSKEEKERLNDSQQFPLTTLIRVVSSSVGKNFLKLTNSETDGSFICHCMQNEFDKALAFILREIISKRMNSRSISSDTMLKEYIEKNYASVESWPIRIENDFLLQEKIASQDKSIREEAFPLNKNDNESMQRKITRTLTKPKTSSWKIPSNISIKTENERLLFIFNELKKINYSLLPNSFAVLLRVFLDLATSAYIESMPELNAKLKSKAKGDFKKLSSLQYRIDFLKSDADISFSEEVKRSIEKFLNYKNIVSLDTLNFYVHSSFILPTLEDLKNQWNFIYEFTKYILQYGEDK